MTVSLMQQPYLSYYFLQTRTDMSDVWGHVNLQSRGNLNKHCYVLLRILKVEVSSLTPETANPN
jgi:hypothetical protein